MAEKAGKVGAIYAAYGDGIDIANESRTLSGGVISLTKTNVLVSKVTSDGAGAIPITKSWYCTVQGELHVTGGEDDTVYVTYKYWNVGVYAHKDAITWTLSTEKNVGDRILPTTPNDYYYEVAEGGAGTTGETEPAEWGTVVGGETVDNTVTWTCHSYSEVGQVAGFFNWSFNKVGDALETTDYSDAGVRTYIAGLKGWTGSAEKHWITEVPLDWIGTLLIIKLYVDNVTSPTLRYEGWGVIVGHGVTSAVDTLVNESLSFQGDSVLTYEST